MFVWIRKYLVFLLILVLVGCSSPSGEGVAPPEVSSSEPQMILALGDSLTAGYNLELREAYPAQLEGILQENSYNYEVTNAGVSGDTSGDLLERIGLYDDMEVYLYLISIGGNDGLRSMDLDDMQSNIEAIITHIQAVNTDAKIVLSGMQIPQNLGLNYARQFKAVFEDIADDTGVVYYDFLLEGVAGNRSLNLPDAIHPNARGYRIVAENMFSFLESSTLIIK